MNQIRQFWGFLANSFVVWRAEFRAVVFTS